MIKIGNTKVNPAGLSKVMVGSSLVWQKVTPPSSPRFKIIMNNPVGGTFTPRLHKEQHDGTVSSGFVVLTGQIQYDTWYTAEQLSELFSGEDIPNDKYALSFTMSLGKKWTFKVNGNTAWSGPDNWWKELVLNTDGSISESISGTSLPEWVYTDTIIEVTATN